MGGIIAVAAVGALTFALTRGESIIPSFLDPGPETPEFAFETVKWKVEATTKALPKDLQDAVEPAVTEAQALLTAYLQGAFVDPDTWGDYEGVFADAMTEDAAADAAKQVDVLTLGATANDSYEFVAPGPSTLRITVLTDGEDAAAQMAAKVRFVASAELTDGTFTDVTSSGTYLLRLVEGDWRIFSFDVARKETVAEAVASATPSAEASA